MLHNGTIAERGTHEDLLALQGRYASMWEKHCRAERAVHEARVATSKANKLLAQVNLSASGKAHHADDPSDGYTSMASSTILQTGLNTPHGDNAGSSSGSDAGSDVSSPPGSNPGSNAASAASSQRDDESVHHLADLSDIPEEISHESSSVAIPTVFPQLNASEQSAIN